MEVYESMYIVTASQVIASISLAGSVDVEK